MSKIMQICKGLEEVMKTGPADFDIESRLVELAQESQDNFDDLIKMYNKAEYGCYKMRLMAALTMLKYRPIIPDLIEVLSIGCTFDQYLAAHDLIEFNEEIGGQHLIKLHEINPQEFNYNYMANDLFYCHTKVAKKYMHLFDKLDLLEKENQKTSES